MGDWLTGMVQGFTDRHREVEQQNYAEGLRAREREGKILQALAASPDPEVKQHAIAGMLDLASPARKAKGLRGWMGEVAQSPYLAAIKNLSPLVHETKTVPDVPTQQGYIPDAPHEVPPGPGALPQGSPIQMGKDGAPESPMRPMTTDFTVDVPGKAVPETPITPDMRTLLGQVPPSTVQLSYDRPRQYLPSAEDQAREMARAKAIGDFTGDVEGAVASGMSREDALALKRLEFAKRMGSGGATPFKSVAGETLINGKWEPIEATLDQTSGQWRAPDQTVLSTFRPNTQGKILDYGDEFEQAAWNRYRARYGQITDPGQLAQIQQDVLNLRQSKGYSSTLGAGLGRADTPMTPQQAQAANVPANTTPNQIAGQSVPSQANHNRRIELGLIRHQIEAQIKPNLSVLPSSREAGIWGPGRVLEARLHPWHPQGAQNRETFGKLQSAVNAIRTSLARAQGDNRVTEADVNRVSQSLVDLEHSWLHGGGDYREVALTKLTETLAYLDSAIASIPPDPTPTTLNTPPPGQTTPGLGRTAAPAARPGGATPGGGAAGAGAVGGGSALDQQAVSASGKRLVIRNGQLVEE